MTNSSIETQASLIKSQLATPGTRLGALARRLESAAKALQEGIDKFGTTASTGTIAGQPVSVPVHISGNLSLSIRVGDGEAKTYSISVGPAKSRSEASLSSFRSDTPEAPSFGSSGVSASGSVTIRTV